MFDAARKGVAITKENLDAAMESRAPDASNLPWLDADSVAPPSPPLADVGDDPRDYIRTHEDLRDTLDDRQRRNPWTEDPPDRGPKLDDTKMGKIGGFFDRITGSKLFKLDEVVANAEQQERYLEGKNNDDPVNAVDMRAAQSLNTELDRIQRGAGIDPAERLKVEPSFFTTEHHEVSNLLMNTADRAARAGASPDEQGRMLDAITGLKDLQAQDGRFPMTPCG